MIKIKIKLNNSKNIQNFCTIVGGFHNDIDLVSGKYVVDAKSIMGIFSLDLSKPISMEIHGDHSEHIVEALFDYIADPI